MTDPINFSTPIPISYARLIALEKMAADLTSKINDSVVLASQTTTAIQERLKHLPELIVQLIALTSQHQECINSIKRVSNWFDKVTHQQETLSKKHSSQFSLTELCEREDELLSWLVNQGLKNNTELLHAFLELGLDRCELDELEHSIDNINLLPDLWLFLEFMLVTETMVNATNSELKHISTLVEAINTCTQQISKSLSQP